MMDKSKLLALKLTALNESDFNWVHSRLAREVKEELGPLINEIKEIGFQVNQKDIDTLLEKKPTYQSIESKDEVFQLIDNAAFDDVQKVYKSESSVLLNTLSEISDWQWKSDKRYIDKSNLNEGVKVRNIASKKLLKSSMLNATANMLKTNAAGSSDQNKAALQKRTFVPSVFGKLLRRNKPWTF